MLRLVATAALLLLATPALADTVVTIENRGTHVLTAINSFPLDADGEPVEDNLGGLEEDEVPPRTRGTLPLSGDCGKVILFLRLADQGGADDLEFRVDTCASKHFVLSD